MQWPAWTCRFSDTQLSVTYQPSSPAQESDCTYLTSLSPLPPSLPGCPSILGPPWEDASPNPNQVSNMFPYASVKCKYDTVTLEKRVNSAADLNLHT